VRLPSPFPHMLTLGMLAASCRAPGPAVPRTETVPPTVAQSMLPGRDTPQPAEANTGARLMLGPSYRGGLSLPASIGAVRLSVTGPDVARPISAIYPLADPSTATPVRLLIPPGFDRLLKVEILGTSGKVVADTVVPNLVITRGQFLSVQATPVLKVGSVAGRLFSGRTGQPEAGFRVSSDGETTLTDAEGRFSLRDLTPGTRTLKLERAGYAGQSLTLSVAAGQTSALGDVTLDSAWQRQLTSTMSDLSDVWFVDNQIGWAVGAGITLKTTNGGRDWVARAPSGGGSAITFRNPLDGWILTGSTLTRTSDGGQTWTSTSHGGDRLFFLDDQTIRIAGSGSSHFSNDGGGTWQSREAASALAFVTGDIGWRGRSNGGISYTNSGGAWWADQVIPDGIGTVIDLRFANPSEGQALTRTGWQIETSDGGANWQILRSPSTTFVLDRFRWHDTRFGYGVAQGVVWMTRDGGEHWARAWMADPGAYVRGVHFLDEQTAWAVCDDGRIYRR